MRGRIRIIHDPEYTWDDCGDINIAYLSRSRYVLGTEGVSESRMGEIRDGIEIGALVGLPVYAYVHSGVCLATTPFSCPWDSGRSGFVYIDAAAAHQIWGSAKPEDDGVVVEDNSGLRKLARERCLEALKGYVDTYSDYLGGQCYGYIVETLNPLLEGVDDDDLRDSDWEEEDSCWGFVGWDWRSNGIKDAIQEYLDRGYVVKEA